MKHLNRFGKGKEQRPRIRLRVLRGYGGYGVGAIISPPAGAAQILLAKKDQLGRPVVEIVPEPVAEIGTEQAAPIAPVVPESRVAAVKRAGKKGK